jgi:hypothetical protein
MKLGTTKKFQGEVTGRYAQPFRMFAQLIATCSLNDHKGRQNIERAAELWFRLINRPTSHFRILPKVLLIGASKCGTSSMAELLSAHPNCLPPFYKEVRFFDSSRIRPRRLDLYRAHYPTQAWQRLKESITGRQLWTADFSPTYYDHPHAPRRIFSTLGNDVKLILMVRNPVDRTYSQYRFQKTLGNETADSFDEALRLEAERIEGEDDRQRADERYFSRKRNHFGYTTRSFYFRYIRNWLEYFPPEQLHLVVLEDFEKAPQTVFDGLCDFLESPRHPINPIVRNASKIQSPMSSTTRSMLVEKFRAHNREMSEFFGRDFDWDQ